MWIKARGWGRYNEFIHTLGNMLSNGKKDITLIGNKNYHGRILNSLKSDKDIEAIITEDDSGNYIINLKQQ